MRALGKSLKITKIMLLMSESTSDHFTKDSFFTILYENSIIHAFLEYSLPCDKTFGNQTQEEKITCIPFHLYKTNPLNNAMYNAIKWLINTG